MKLLYIFIASCVGFTFSVFAQNPYRAKQVSEVKLIDKSADGVRKISEEDFDIKIMQDGKVKTEILDLPNQRFAVFKAKKGTVVPVHDHDSDEVGYIVKGSVKFVFGPEKREFIFNKGDIFVIPRNIYHEVIILKDLELLAFHPATTKNENSKFRH